LGMFSEKKSKMYTTLFGGMTFGFFSNGQFQTDSEIPFTNQVTTISINKHGKYAQHLMQDEYPVIVSTQSNPGNVLLFGAGAQFIPKNGIPMYENMVLKMDEIKGKSALVG